MSDKENEVCMFQLTTDIGLIIKQLTYAEDTYCSEDFMDYICEICVTDECGDCLIFALTNKKK